MYGSGLRPVGRRGFGSKGVSLAPRLAAQLADYLAGKGALWPEADLQRYARLHTENAGLGVKE